MSFRRHGSTTEGAESLILAEAWPELPRKQPTAAVNGASGMLPKSYQEGLVCKNTFLTLLEDLDTDDESTVSDNSCRGSGSRARANSECTGLLRLRSSGHVDFSAWDHKFDSGSESANAQSNDGDDAAGVFEREDQAENAAVGDYIPTWCRMTQTSEDSSMVVPCLDEASLAAAHEAGEALYLWCWAQPDGAGGTIVVPCTDREPPCAAVQPPSTAEVACAPEPPAAGDFRPLWASGPCWPFNVQPTTLVISRLPKALTQEAFLEVLDRLCLSGYYDFVYLAADPSTELSCGEAVVNLTRHEYGLALAAKLHGRSNWGIGDSDEEAVPCQVRWSLPLQGLDDLVKQYREHPWNSEDVPDEMRPLMFQNGWPVPFPAAGSEKETTYFGFAGW
eukprot:TRINITY_DN55755_c0_g1_i1.p1 TRINITY_DN55755_c0_g1~~TRINITY_DN55755_c0_g1_i1.p1  ORF type:complete len:391 (+),score=89.82 TRINITY_DN55755_c0_g1_i1:197-1369(+)